MVRWWGQCNVPLGGLNFLPATKEGSCRFSHRLDQMWGRSGRVRREA